MLPSYVWRIVVKRGERERIRKEGNQKLRYGIKLGGTYTLESQATRQYESLRQMGFECKLYRSPCNWELIEEE